MPTKNVPAQASKNGAIMGWVLTGIPNNAVPLVIGQKLWFWDAVTNTLLEAEACRTEFVEQDAP